MLLLYFSCKFYLLSARKFLSAIPFPTTQLGGELNWGIRAWTRLSFSAKIEKPLCVSTRAAYLKCKTSKILFILFGLLFSFQHRSILFLHTECLYKVGQRNFFRQAPAPFAQLVCYAYRLCIRQVCYIVFCKQDGHCPFIPIWRIHAFGFAEIAYRLINSCVSVIAQVVNKAICRQFIAFCNLLYKPQLLALFYERCRRISRQAYNRCNPTVTSLYHVGVIQAYCL